MKFIIWGAGHRGKELTEVIGADKVLAFIDSNQNIKTYLGKEVIDFETYLRSYRNYFIIISPFFKFEEIEETLRENDVYQYFLLNNAPSELGGYGDEEILEKLPLKIDNNAYNAIYGDELFSVLLYSELEKRGCKNLILLCRKETNPIKMEKITELLGITNIRTIDEVPDDIDNIYVTVLEKMDNIRRLVGEKCNLIDAFDFSTSLEDYHNKKIEKFSNLHKGKRCFIVALGGSLREEDLNKLHDNNEISFSMNRIYKAFDNVEWRPDYYICADRKGLELMEDDILKMQVKNKFLVNSGVNIDKFKDENVYRTNIVVLKTKSGLTKFSDDCSRRVYVGGTVVYGCIQLAAYMGFSEIILLGVDFDYDHNSSAKHFYEKGKNTGSGTFDKDEVVLAFNLAKEYAEEHGIRIVNATRGGKLEIFDRVDFDSLF